MFQELEMLNLSWNVTQKVQHYFNLETFVMIIPLEASIFHLQKYIDLNSPK